MGYIFNRGALGLSNTSINWATDTIKLRLVLTSETISEDATSMTGLGIPSTDVVLAGKTITEDTANNRIVFSGSNFIFPLVPPGPQVDRLIVFKFVTNDAGSTPIALCDVPPFIPSGGDVSMLVSANGIFYKQQ